MIEYVIIIAVLFIALQFVIKKYIQKWDMKRIDRSSGAEFEEYLAILFREMGYRVRKTPNTGDYGADLILYKEKEKIVVQAKRYNSYVDQAAVREAVAAVAYYKADRAMVVTNSKFTTAAIRLAKSNQVELLDRKWLYKAIDKKNLLSGAGEKAVLTQVDINYRRLIETEKNISAAEIEKEIDEILFDKGYNVKRKGK